jgi:hypothetical protein
MAKGLDSERRIGINIIGNGKRKGEKHEKEKSHRVSIGCRVMRYRYGMWQLILIHRLVPVDKYGH